MKNGKVTVAVIVTALLVMLVTPGVHAQMIVADAGVTALLNKMGAEQYIYYAQSLVELYNNAQNTYNQFQNLLRAEQRALDNLKGIADVKNFDDFMKWQNRQLYLEQETEERFWNMGIKIGNQTYKTAEIKEIPNAIRENYVNPDYMDNGLSDEQRKQMYVTAGLSPSNYRFVKHWEAIEEEIGKKLFTAPDIVNDENQNSFAYFKDLAQKYDRDAKADEDKKIHEKEILMDIALTNMELAKAIMNGNLDDANFRRYLYALIEESKRPENLPDVTVYNESPFGKF